MEDGALFLFLFCYFSFLVWLIPWGLSFFLVIKGVVGERWLEGLINTPFLFLRRFLLSPLALGKLFSLRGSFFFSFLFSVSLFLSLLFCSEFSILSSWIASERCIAKAIRVSIDPI